MLRFVRNQFNADQVTTVGAAFLQSPVPLDDSDDKIQFGIWDTAGSERYKALAPMYYRGAEAAIVVYDITSYESFEGAKNWVRELQQYGQPNVVVALAANKCDLEQYRVVSTRDGQEYAREHELTYFETSAKTAHNVRRMFVELGARPASRLHLIFQPQPSSEDSLSPGRSPHEPARWPSPCLALLLTSPPPTCPRSPACAAQGPRRPKCLHQPRASTAQAGRRVHLLRGVERSRTLRAQLASPCLLMGVTRRRGWSAPRSSLAPQ